MARSLLVPSGMKTLGSIFPGRHLELPKAAFATVLKQQPPPLPKSRPVAPLPPGFYKRSLPSEAPRQAPVAVAAKGMQQVLATQKTVGTLTAARTAAHQGVAELQHARGAHHEVAEKRLKGRVVDLICNELVAQFNDEGPKPKGAHQELAPPTLIANLPSALAPEVRPVGNSRPVDGATRASQAVELIEKIESFLKNARTPCLCLTLNNSLGSTVEIERIGPREVALKLTGHKGPPSAEDISRIRDEMTARGLKVCALSVA